MRIGSLTASTLLKRLNLGDYHCVPSELAKWVKASDPKTGKKVALLGLMRRRAAEGTLWLKTETDDPFLNSTDMQQRVHADDPRTTYLVTARDGLRMRSGAGAQFDIVQVLPRDTEVFVMKEKDSWAAVDLQGDGAIDGWVALDFLKLKQV
jgi:lysozyme